MVSAGNRSKLPEAPPNCFRDCLCGFRGGPDTDARVGVSVTCHLKTPKKDHVPSFLSV